MKQKSYYREVVPVVVAGGFIKTEGGKKIAPRFIPVSV